MSESVRVGVRVRPLNERELAGAAQAGKTKRGPAWEADATEHRISSLPSAGAREHKFSFDYVFEPTATNEDLYDDLAKPVVEAALAGYNGTVFAYGQTSSGKTHSMVGNPSDPGVKPRALEHVMRVAKEKAGGRRYLVRVTYCEIYNEVIRDLMNPNAGEIKVREDANGKTFIRAEEIVVNTVDEAMDVLRRGQDRRSVGATAMNAESSRSHTIFTLIIESRGEALGSEKCLRASTLHLVDLAGSERAKSTYASGERLKEGSHINKSLLTLGTIINKLSSRTDAARAHLPYRDSNLTRVLRDALGGNARTSVLCAITPSPLHIEETLSTLKFAQRANNVTNSAVRNEVVDYKAKYLEAMAELKVLRANGGAAAASSGDIGGHVNGGDEGETRTGGESGGTAPTSDADPVALMMELERAREDVAYLKEQAQTAELDASHYQDSLKDKAGKVRALRSDVAKAQAEVSELSGKQETLQLAIAQAYFRLQTLRTASSKSKKRSSGVAINEDELDAVMLKLAMFIPDEEFMKRKLDVGGASPSGMTPKKVDAISRGAWATVSSRSSLTSDATNGLPSPISMPRRHSELATPHPALPGLRPASTYGSSPMTPDHAPTTGAIPPRAPSDKRERAIPRSHSHSAAHPPDSRRESLVTEGGSDEGAEVADRPPAPPSASPDQHIPVLDFDEYETVESADGSDASDAADDASARTMRKRKSQMLQGLRSFYGASSNLQDRFSGGHKVSSS